METRRQQVDHHEARCAFDQTGQDLLPTAKAVASINRPYFGQPARYSFLCKFIKDGEKYCSGKACSGADQSGSTIDRDKKDACSKLSQLGNYAVSRPHALDCHGGAPVPVGRYVLLVPRTRSRRDRRCSEVA